MTRVSSQTESMASYLYCASRIVPDRDKTLLLALYSYYLPCALLFIDDTSRYSYDFRDGYSSEETTDHCKAI